MVDSHILLAAKKDMRGGKVQKISTLKKYLNKIGFTKEANYLEYLIKIAVEISLSGKIKEEIKGRV